MKVKRQQGVAEVRGHSVEGGTGLLGVVGIRGGVRKIGLRCC